MSEPNEPQDEHQVVEPEAPTVVHVAPYHWQIEGRDVFLRQREADGTTPAPDTEDVAQRVYAEAFAHRQ